MANQFKRGDSVKFKTVGAGVTSNRRGVVVKTVDSGRGIRVEVKDKEGRVFRPHLSMVKLAP
ncbi:hypothetical protein GCM10011504_26090 [Siccirubricoccus deserti]|uniref:Uncharacterized protein n=1 Tax=Siccirubricoccus deserti TaxID=2013562 RepID=A0A9X0UHB4_9PROT|nr:hypothetical protein [Siccirubricoccus deserti]MBC4016060.1 hypothetical protein [Siccirubricoccus deserti]GGC46456.1 hypothetical protein GCM10011504_26090 [Siccirubricoccus deserti]